MDCQPHPQRAPVGEAGQPGVAPMGKACAEVTVLLFSTLLSIRGLYIYTIPMYIDAKGLKSVCLCVSTGAWGSWWLPSFCDPAFVIGVVQARTHSRHPAQAGTVVMDTVFPSAYEQIMDKAKGLSVRTFALANAVVGNTVVGAPRA